MALKIRLRQQGRTNRKFYRLVVTDSRARRDGKYTEMLGWYNPAGEGPEGKVSIDGVRIKYWLENGAQLTNNARTLVTKQFPEIIREQKEKVAAKRAKEQAKRRMRRQKKASA